MSRRRAIECPREPIGLSAEEAAAFIGVSASTFQKAVDERLMPSPRTLFKRVLWDADEVRMAFRQLPQKDRTDHADGGTDWSDVAA
jgi:predicted DNA-binding transcriptional regulator AlpA